MSPAHTEELAGRVALITGAADGIGLATARTLAASGARVVLVDRAADAGRAALAALTDIGEAAFVPADVTDLDAMTRAVDLAVHRWGTLDIACNNAAIGLTGPLVHEVAVDDFARVTTVDLVGTFVCMKAELTVMLSQQRGTIVNVSSNLGAAAVAGQSAYIAAKHGVIGLTRAAALEYATHGVRVNAVLPGVVETATITALHHRDPDRAALLRSRHPIGRFARTQEIADAIAWLASDHSSYVTGASIDVDGGYLAQ